jgi:hypothetical protein
MPWFQSPELQNKQKQWNGTVDTVRLKKGTEG